MTVAKMQRVAFWTAGLIGGSAVLLAANAWSGGPSVSRVSEQVAAENMSSGPLPVSVVHLGNLSAPPRVDDYRGTIEASKEAELAFRRSGRVARIAVEEGDHVTRGQTLANLEVDNLQALIEATEARVREAEAVLSELVAGPRKQTIAAAAADVAQMKAAVELAKITTARELDMQRSNSSSLQSYDNARFQEVQQQAAWEAANQKLQELKAGTRTEQLVAQRARVAILQAQLKGYQVDLRDGKIEAPFDGVVARRFVDEGTIASPERVVLRVLQIDPLEARFGVAPEDAQNLSPGQGVRVTVGTTAIDAVVARIEPELDRSTRTQSVLVAIPRSNSERGDARDGIVPGRTASLSLGSVRSGDTHSFWVPITSLARSTRGLWSLMVVVGDSDSGFTVQRRDVQVLETDTRLARISGGMVASGDTVVAAGLHRVTPGMAVVPTDVSSDQPNIATALK